MRYSIVQEKRDTGRKDNARAYQEEDDDEDAADDDDEEGLGEDESDDEEEADLVSACARCNSVEETCADT